MYTLRIIKYKFHSTDEFKGQGELCYNTRTGKFIRNYSTFKGIGNLELVRLVLVENKLPSKGENFLYDTNFNISEWTRKDNATYPAFIKAKKVSYNNNSPAPWRELQMTACKRIHKVVEDEVFINCVVLGTYEDGDSFNINEEDEIIQYTTFSGEYREKRTGNKVEIITPILSEYELTKINSVFNFDWKPRYSITDDFDDKNRWARICYIKDYALAWVNKLKLEDGKIIFTIHEYFPSTHSIGPDVNTTSSFEEAKQKVEDDFKNFIKNIL